MWSFDGAKRQRGAKAYNQRLSMPRNEKSQKGDKPLDAVADYRYKDKRKNNPPAKIAAEGFVPLVPKAEYFYTPRRPPELRFDVPAKPTSCPPY